MKFIFLCRIDTPTYSYTNMSYCLWLNLMMTIKKNILCNVKWLVVTDLRVSIESIYYSVSSSLVRLRIGIRTA